MTLEFDADKGGLEFDHDRGGGRCRDFGFWILNFELEDELRAEWRAYFSIFIQNPKLFPSSHQPVLLTIDVRMRLIESISSISGLIRSAGMIKPLPWCQSHCHVRNSQITSGDL